MSGELLKSGRDLTTDVDTVIAVVTLLQNDLQGLASLNHRQIFSDHVGLQTRPQINLSLRIK